MKLSLKRIPRPHFSNPFDLLQHNANCTLARAHHLNHPSTATQTPLSHIGSGYMLALPIGTPPQVIPAIFDTGSVLTWVPCTSHYSCTHCTVVAKFKPNLSSSTRNISCTNPICLSIYGSDPHNCTGSSSCLYQQSYGLGNTTGNLISETLDLYPPENKTNNFVIGCSISSTQQSAGIAGFGLALYSIPAQLKLSKFSYFLISHEFDDTNKSSQLFLYIGSGGGVSYTPFGKNPALSPFNVYYYVDVGKITVGGEDIKIPYKYFRPGPNRSGGTIVDSGTTHTYMDTAVYGPVVAHYKAQLTQRKGIREFRVIPNLGLCFKMSAHEKAQIPELVFHFKGGAQMGVPVTDDLPALDQIGIACLTITRGDNLLGIGGPAVILGNNQQRNFYIEFDLKNQRFGFKKQTCG